MQAQAQQPSCQHDHLPLPAPPPLLTLMTAVVLCGLRRPMQAAAKQENQHGRRHMIIAAGNGHTKPDPKAHISHTLNRSCTLRHSQVIRIGGIVIQSAPSCIESSQPSRPLRTHHEQGYSTARVRGCPVSICMRHPSEQLPAVVLVLELMMCSCRQ
jgi:hypothetical protein